MFIIIFFVLLVCSSIFLIGFAIYKDSKKPMSFDEPEPESKGHEDSNKIIKQTNIGSHIKTISTVFLVLSIILVLILGIMMIASKAENMVGYGILTIIFGIALSYVFFCFIRGFGELVECTIHNKETQQEILNVLILLTEHKQGSGPQQTAKPCVSISDIQTNPDYQKVLHLYQTGKITKEDYEKLIIEIAKKYADK